MLVELDGLFPVTSSHGIARMPRETRAIVSLFCGAGGLDLGFRQAGYRAVLACDNSLPAVKSFNANTRLKVARQLDLTTVSVGEFLGLVGKAAGTSKVVGLIGGPPCQGFSRANIQKRHTDPRNRLLTKYAELLAALNKAHDLDFFVFENVLGLGCPMYRSRFATLQGRLKDAGFDIFPFQLNANRFSVAQNRPRLFVVGINTKHAWKSFVPPSGSGEKVVVRTVLEGLPTPALYSRGLTPGDIPFHPNHWTMVPRSARFGGPLSAKSRSFKRLDWEEESPTVAYGNREIHVHPNGTRRLSILEAMLLQGFPRSYRLKGTLSDQVTQVSNAVPPPVARALAEQINKTFRLARRQAAGPRDEERGDGEREEA